jgi:hypothetical protein
LQARSISQYSHSISFVFSYEKYTEPFVIFALKFVVVDPSWPASVILIHTFQRFVVCSIPPFGFRLVSLTASAATKLQSLRIHGGRTI